MKPSDQFRRDAGHACEMFRLQCAAPRYSWGREHMVIAEGLREIIALRLTLAYLPIIKDAERIERLFGDIVVQLKPVQYGKVRK